MSQAFDPNARLSSGMKVTEAIARARKWWGEYRGMVRREFTQIDATRKRVSRTSDGGLLSIVKDAFSDPHVQSGILRGLPWDELSELDQMVIVKTWHEQHVVKAARLVH